MLLKEVTCQLLTVVKLIRVCYIFCNSTIASVPKTYIATLIIGLKNHFPEIEFLTQPGYLILIIYYIISVIH